MRAKKRSVEEQMSLIMECRKSGMSDYQWCEKNAIPGSTFYTWITRLRKEGYKLPKTEVKYNNSFSTNQEIVKVEVVSKELKAPTVVEQQNTPITKSLVEESDDKLAVEVFVSGATIRFFNNTNPKIIKYTLDCIGGNKNDW